MSDLTEFVLARIAEDEREIEADPPVGMGYAMLHRRMSVECQAKRRIVGNLKWFAPTDPLIDPDAILRLLAAPYADHHEYRREWAV